MAPWAVVTGANSGIGLEVARRLLLDGWSVWALDLSIDGLRELAAAFPAALAARVCDVRSESSVVAAFREIRASGHQVRALVCSAGVLRTAPLASMSTDDFDLLFSVNTRGAWLCAREGRALLEAAASRDEPGRIVMIGSIAAVRPKVGGGAYAATKAALSQIVRVMAVELAPGHLRVNAVAPSTVDTPMIRGVAAAGAAGGYRASGVSPVGRVSTASDIAPVVQFLLSPASDYINGVTIAVDGGTSAAFVPA